MTKYLKFHPELNLTNPEATVRIYLGTLFYYVMLPKLLYGKDIIPLEREKLTETLTQLITVPHQRYWSLETTRTNKLARVVSISSLKKSLRLELTLIESIFVDLKCYNQTELIRRKFKKMIATILSILLAIMIFLFIFRIVLTWYPQANLNSFPFNLIAWPTEPFLVPVRKIIPPLGGVDISPIILVGIFSLIREILLGQQGLITMALR